MKYPAATLILLFVVIHTAGFARAQTEQAQPFAPADIARFEKRIRPILVRRCYECHSREAKTLQGGLRVDRRASLLAGGDSGPAVVPGDPQRSLLIQTITYENEDLAMPPSGKLSAREIAELAGWVKGGAPFPDDDKSVVRVETGIDFSEGRRFWSFQRPRIQTLPPVSSGAWPRRRIDVFVLAQLGRRGLVPSPPAGRRNLIRRATFDLLGLPPTLEEVEAFVNDSAPDAFERLIDRLLASPRYGERWGRFWLDLARYTDTTASWLKSTGQAWLYRDWVVRALNEDMPYNDFVCRQVATDLMPETGPEDRAALGFLGLSPTYWKELKLDKDVIKTVVAEEWEERIDAVGRTFLGLTLACARCHDHKFDPVSSADYYALAGVFASTRLVDRPIVSDQQWKRIQDVRQQIRDLEQRVERMQENKPATPDSQNRIASLTSQINELRASTPSLNSPQAHAVEDAAVYVLADGPDKTKIDYKPGVARDVRLHIRGNPANPGQLVRRRFLTVLSPDPPPLFQRGSGRLELARAIVGDGAPLAARVIVNRAWRHLFGRGLVDTPSNFGSQGSRPSHPRLLDDLAARFIENGWSIKWLHREIILSATYRQSSAYDERQQNVDPDNRWLWRMNRRRLDIEAWRDAMLWVAGNLDLRIGGSPDELSNPENGRRTIYGKIHRRELNAMLRLHDFPDPTSHSPAREMTITPLQQLFVLNSDFLQRQSAAVVQRLKTGSATGAVARVRHAYQLVLNREPTDGELKLAIEFIGHDHNDSNPDENRWRQYVQVLLGGNEFAFVD